MYEIKEITAHELENKSGGFYELADLPEQEHVSIFLDINIGEVGNEASDIFYVYVITGKYREEIRKLNSDTETRGRFLYFDTFNGKRVVEKINEIIEICTDKNWEKTASNLTKYFPYEYENHQHL